MARKNPVSTPTRTLSGAALYQEMQRLEGPIRDDGGTREDVIDAARERASSAAEYKRIWSGYLRWMKSRRARKNSTGFVAAKIRAHTNAKRNGPVIPFPSPISRQALRQRHNEDTFFSWLGWSPVSGGFAEGGFWALSLPSDHRGDSYEGPYYDHYYVQPEKNRRSHRTGRFTLLHSLGPRDLVFAGSGVKKYSLPSKKEVVEEGLALAEVPEAVKTHRTLSPFAGIAAAKNPRG